MIIKTLNSYNEAIFITTFQKRDNWRIELTSKNIFARNPTFVPTRSPLRQFWTLALLKLWNIPQFQQTRMVMLPQRLYHLGKCHPLHQLNNHIGVVETVCNEKVKNVDFVIILKAKAPTWEKKAKDKIKISWRTLGAILQNFIKNYLIFDRSIIKKIKFNKNYFHICKQYAKNTW